MNSISELMDADDIVAEIRMERQSFQGSYMLVEGPTDVRRFEKFIDTDVCSFVNCWGKSKLLGAVQRLNALGLHEFIALADADFDRLRGTLELHDNLYYSNSHDFEIDTVHTEVLARYLKEVADEDLLPNYGTVPDVIGMIADGLRPLSGAKLANRTGTINYPLSELDWLPSFDGLGINRERLAYLILKKEGPTREAITRLVAVIDAAAKFDLWQLTNGHDFFTALGYCLQTKIAKRHRYQCTASEVETHIRLALSETDFRMMEIFQLILDWENERGRRLLKNHLH